MEVILLEDVSKLGDMGELVDVKPGYARNYLIPQKLAVIASTGNRSRFAHQQKMVEARKVKMRKAAEEIFSGLNQLSVTIAKKAGDQDTLFGSVTNRDITAALASSGYEVDHKKIRMDRPLRELGIFEIDVKLHADIVATVKVWVVKI